METLLTTTVRRRTKNGLGFPNRTREHSVPRLQDTARLSPKSAAIRDPRAKEWCSATAFRVQLTFLNACCSERALKAQSAAVELALPAAAAARAKER